MTKVARSSFGAGAIGVILIGIGVAHDPRQALTSYLFAYATVLTIVLGALMQLMVGFLTGAEWFAKYRRLAVAVTGTLPALVVLVLPILVGVREIYSWAAPSALPVAEQSVVAAKAAWLNVPFFVARGVVYLAVWTLAGELLRRAWLAGNGRIAEDAPRARRLRKASALGVIAIGLALTFASFDWLMSLEPTWYSTIYGVYVFAGSYLSSLALIAMLAYPLRTRDRAPTDAAVAEDDGSLGTLLLTFVIFWAYIGFSQFLIIWIADVPAEVSWYVVRTRGGWGVLALVIAIGQFALPFLLLLLRSVKRKARTLAWIGSWLVAMHALDIYWLVLPSLHPRGLTLSWLDPVALLMVAGLVVGAAAWRDGAQPATAG